MRSIAIFCGGGPAPGINAVISSIARPFLSEGYRVIGVHDGFKGLLSAAPETVDIDFEYADRIFSLGGSSLRMSRFKPSEADFKSAFFKHNNIQLLVSIGGDDTASSASRLADFLNREHLDVRNVHVPKTIDNDLPLPEGVPTFGYQSAKETGSVIANTIYEDARTSQNWFVMCVMGREAGHLAFGIGSACQYPMIIIPEMFNHTPITVDKIVKLVISSIVKRKLLGIHYGVAMISEGVFHFIGDDDLTSTGIQFTYDAHGHPELNQVSKAHIFNQLVVKQLKDIGLPITPRPVEIGYSLRCCKPIGYDLNYCGQLGRGVYALFTEGKTGCMVAIDSTGNVLPLYLKDLKGPDGRIQARLVNVESQSVRAVYDHLHYLTANDIEKANRIITHADRYVFHSILNWQWQQSPLDPSARRMPA